MNYFGRIAPVILFFAAILFLSTSKVAAAPGIHSSVHVLVTDQQNLPMPEIEVFLDLYFYDDRTSPLEIRGAFSDQCTTDINGKCTITIGETTDVLRGRLDLGEYGGRDLIWQGGRMDVSIQVSEGQNQPAAQSNRLNLEKNIDGALTRNTIWFLIVFAILIFGIHAQLKRGQA